MTTLRKVGLVAAFLMAVTTGCWDRRELHELNIVAGVGVDAASEERIALSVQVVLPGGGVGAPASQLGEGGGEQKLVLVDTSEGKSVFEAKRDMVTEMSRRLFFAHARVLLIGKEAAKKGVRGALDFFVRDREGRTTTLLFTSEPKALQIMKAQVGVGPIPALNLANLDLISRETGKTDVVRIQDFLERLMLGTSSPIAPHLDLIEKEGRKQVRTVGMSVFRKDRMVGILNPRETRGLLWVTGRMRGGVLVVTGPGGEKVTLESLRASSRITPRLVSGTAHFDVEVSDSSAIGSSEAESDITTAPVLLALERRQADLIRQDIQASLEKAKKLNTDVFGFGETIHRRFPREWRLIKDRWDETFQHVEVDVRVLTKIRSLGLATSTPLGGAR